MFCEESLGNIKLRAFPKRVRPRILSFETVDYFGASEHYWVVENKNKNLNYQNSDDPTNLENTNPYWYAFPHLENTYP